MTDIVDPDLDEACKQYDLAYAKHKDANNRNRADDILAGEATRIALDESKPKYERRDDRIVTCIMGLKSQFGTGTGDVYYNPKTGYMGISDMVSKIGLLTKVVKNWLEKQEVYTLQNLTKDKFETRRFLVNGIDDQWQADLVDMRSLNDGDYSYILTVNDGFSKYA